MTNLPGSGSLTPSTATPQHRASGPDSIRFALLTISDTRTPETDTSGLYLRGELLGAGHELVEHLIVKDDAVDIRAALTRLLHRADLIITSGGTGIAGRDVTIPVVESMLVKPIPGFGELFRMLSYQQVKGAAMLSRAVGGLTRGALLFALPGSLNAVQTAWEGLLKDEVGHLVFEVLRQGQPGPATMPGSEPQLDRQAHGVQSHSGQVHSGHVGAGLHVNQGLSAGIGRHAGVVGSESPGTAQLGRHATVKDDSPQ